MSSEALEIVSREARWNQCYARLTAPSVYASYGYMQAGTSLVDGGIAEAAVLTRDADVLFHPYIRSPVLGTAGIFDLVSVYDFGGFWFSTDDPERRRELIRHFEEEFAQHAAQTGIVCEFTRLHPFIDAQKLGFQRYELHKRQDNVVIPLNQSHAEIRRRYSQSRRNQVMQGIRNGLAFTLTRDTSIFIRLYHDNLDHLGADREYYFPHWFLERILPHLLIAHVHDRDGKLCAAHVYLADGDVLFLYLSASVQDTLPLRPNDFGYDAMIQHASAAGFKTLHLGGGAETLYRYKRAFSPVTVPYYHLRTIFDRARYDELVCQNVEAFPATVGTRFFPAYRAALRSPRHGQAPADS